MLWRSDDAADSIPAIYALPLAPDALDARVDDLRAALLAESGRSGTLPQPRDGQQRIAAIARLTSTERVVDLLPDLTAALLPPGIAVRMRDLAKLTIVPALNVGTAPFALLDPGGTGHPLVESVSLTIAPSLNSVAIDQQMYEWSSPKAAVVFGNPDASKDPDWIFPRLPGAESEAREVAKIFHVTATLGKEVTPANVEASMVGADYIHIAAHGYSDPKSPLDNSFLALTGGRLTARQVQNMKFDQLPLVVLSACQTGLGAVQQAGIIGLARGFLLAGASEVVASLWNVSDEATAFMMDDFATNLATMEPAEALRRAQLATRAKYPDPALWASFVEMGNGMISQ